MIPRLISRQLAIAAARLMVLLAVLCAPAASRAGPNDFRLSGLVRCQTAAGASNYSCGGRGGVFEKDEAGFDSLMKEVGFAMAPRLLQPAETLGLSGWDLGFFTSFTVINADQPYWKAVDDRAPDSVLSTGTLHARKGLPFGFEIGGHFDVLFSSQLLGLGGEVKWAPLEGFWYLPDFAIRGAVTQVVGNSDIRLTVSEFNGVLSKEIGILGNFTLTPFAAYGMNLVFTGGNLIDPSPSSLQDNPGTEVVFGQRTLSLHKLVGGLRLLVYKFAIYFEGDVALGADNPLYSLSGKIGLEF
ncbi:MAG: hypothetical protein GMKNLPBB_01189 [Myxococcota bacterium]|nr:hypothetical protein [Myxococcota bacterium]